MSDTFFVDAPHSYVKQSCMCVCVIVLGRYISLAEGI